MDLCYTLYHHIISSVTGCCLHDKVCLPKFCCQHFNKYLIHYCGKVTECHNTCDQSVGKAVSATICSGSLLTCVCVCP